MIVSTLGTALMVAGALAAVMIHHRAPKCPSCGSSKATSNDVFDYRVCDGCGTLYTVGRR